MVDSSDGKEDMEVRNPESRLLGVIHPGDRDSV